MILSQILCFWKRRCGSSYEALSRNKARIDLAFLVHMVLAAKAPLLYATARYAREGLGTLGNAWERQLLSWHVLKIKRGHTDGTENTDKRKLVGSTSSRPISLRMPWERRTSVRHIFWERLLLSWQVLKSKPGHTDGTENTDKRKLVGPTSSRPISLRMPWERRTSVRHVFWERQLLSWHALEKKDSRAYRETSWASEVCPLVTPR
jgi:hypothetical protein